MCLSKMLFQQEPDAQLVGGDRSSLLHREMVGGGEWGIGSAWGGSDTC